MLVVVVLLLSIPSPDGRSIREAQMHLFYSTRTATTIARSLFLSQLSSFFLFFGLPNLYACVWIHEQVCSGCIIVNERLFINELLYIFCNYLLLF
jgi:Ni,Fe-hydrogenase I small subunit